jgi:hypothetical protein
MSKLRAPKKHGQRGENNPAVHMDSLMITRLLALNNGRTPLPVPNLLVTARWSSGLRGRHVEKRRECGRQGARMNVRHHRIQEHFW